MKSVASLLPFQSWVYKNVENKRVVHYSLNVLPDAMLCFVSYFPLSSVTFYLIIPVLTLLLGNVRIHSRLVLDTEGASVPAMIIVLMGNMTFRGRKGHVQSPNDTWAQPGKQEAKISILVLYIVIGYVL